MAAQSNPQTQQFLSNVRSQRGPSALPYTEDVQWLIRQHLLALTSTYPSLIPKSEAGNRASVDGESPTRSKEAGEGCKKSGKGRVCWIWIGVEGLGCRRMMGPR
ncbi:hypothetical protein Droror1_Dr00005648, partial [Drosera rotundifolia]